MIHLLACTQLRCVRNTPYIQRVVAMLKYEWDEEKEWQNYLKHRVRFNEAQMIWADPLADEFYDEFHSDSEDRFIRRGIHPSLGLLIVIFCERGHSIRIISARKANFAEKVQYEKKLRL